MGREAKVDARLGDAHGPCTVLLESHALILRGAISATLPLDGLGSARATATGLHASTPRGALHLALGEKVAASWLKKLRDGPPSLAGKLGFDSDTRIALLAPDPELEAVATAAGARIVALSDAHLWLAPLHDAQDLERLLAQLARTPLAHGQSLWTIRTKGPKAALKETTLMTALARLDLVPTKTASVSETRSADRYSPRRR